MELGESKEMEQMGFSVFAGATSGRYRSTMTAIGSESWVLNARGSRRAEVAGMLELRRAVGVKLISKITNRDIIEVYENKVIVLERVYRRILKWFGHVEKMV